MKFSIEWLSDFVKVKDFLSDPDKLSESLTRTGLEVESIQNLSEQLKCTVVAEIQSLDKHPNADKLTICKVSTGKKTYPIVCGAKNHKAGDKVVLALEGAVLPGDFVIKKSKIRGEVSEGMLSSSSELGLEEKSEGILILPKEAPVGMDFSEYYGLNQIILDINVTPNRADCLSHLGLAREISCLFDRDFSKKEKSFSVDKKLSVKKKIKLEVSDKKSCPRYSGRYIEGVTIKESPKWLKDRLKSVGLKSINNIVDVTNYVLWNHGQPLHAFDADTVASLSVKKSVKGEKFKALDESLLELTGEELTIRDKDKVLALAGVIGGMDSGISENTKNVFLESAYFRPEEVRRTARRFGLQTDSSYRFSRGTDPEMVKEALDFACAMIQELAGGKVSDDFYDFYAQPEKPSKISITIEDLENRLGYKIKSSQFIKWMKNLKCEIKECKSQSFEITVPSFRSDLRIKEDLIEEFARLEGYDNIPEISIPKSLPPKDWDDQFLNIQNLQSLMRSQGWYQIINYSFSDPELYKDFFNSKENLSEVGLRSFDFFSVANPISSHLSIMKNFLTPDVFKTIQYNFRHGNKSGQVFEISPCFYQDKNDYGQDNRLALGSWGKPVDLWKGKEASNVLYLKSLMELTLNRLGYKSFNWKQVSPSIPFLHPKQVLLLEVQNKPIGFIGTLHPRLQSKYKIPLDVALGEFQLDELWRCSSKKVHIKKPSDFLTIEKDISFLIPSSLAVIDVQREIKRALGHSCEKVDIFDIYQKGDGRSVSFRFYLIPDKVAWTDKDLQDFQNKIIESLSKKFNIGLS